MLTGNHSPTIPLPAISLISPSTTPVNFPATYHGYFPSHREGDAQATLPAPSEAAQLSHSELVNGCANSMAEWLWEEFYRRFDPRIRIYVRRSWRQRLSNSNDLRISDEITDDLTQNVYVRLLSDNCQALRDFKGLTNISFLAYLARIATNIVAEYFRSLLAGKRYGANLSVEYLLDEHHISQNHTQEMIYEYLSENPERRYIGRLLMLEITRLIKQFSHGPNRARDQRILELYFMEGFPIPQIAAIINSPLKLRSIESIIRRAQQRLFRQLRVPEKFRNSLLLSAWTTAAKVKSTNSLAPAPEKSTYHQLTNKWTTLDSRDEHLIDNFNLGNFHNDLADSLMDNLTPDLSLELRSDLVTAWVN
jgi:RNA polymerase sigma factor (sigma-70 family)